MANYNEEVFLPDDVDEQIDEYLTLPPPSIKQPFVDGSAKEALQALQQHFTPPEQNAALQRVWQRFENSRTTIQKRERTMPRVTLQQERISRMKPLTTSSQQSRRIIPMQRLGVLAAAVFLALLVGSMITVFSLASSHKQTTTASNHKQTSADNAQQASKDMFALVNATLYRLDTTTHKTLWQFQVPGLKVGTPGSLPVRGQLVDDTYYITGIDKDQEKLYALDAATGKERWEQPIPGGTLSKPIITAEKVYVVSAKNDTAFVQAFNSHNGSEQWKHPLGKVTLQSLEGAPLQISPAVTLLAATEKEIFGEQLTSKNGVQTGLRFALSAVDGSTIWQKNEELANVASINDGFLVNDLLVVAKNKDIISTPVKDAPKSAEAKPYTPHGVLAAYDPATGKQVWSKELNAQITAYGTTVLNGNIYLSTNDLSTGKNSIAAFSTKDGTQLWQHDDTSGGSSYATVTENGIYFNLYKGQKLVALDLATGKESWTYTFHDALTVEFPPAADNGQVYLSLANNVVQVLNAADGKEGGKFIVDTQVDPNNRVLIQPVG